jgi:hypothetical protein
MFTAILVTQCASAYIVNSSTISPAGTITSKGEVTATLVLEFPAPSEKGTFNSSNDLNFQTDLDQARWEMTITEDGMARPTVPNSGWSVFYSGYAISTFPYVKELMTVVVRGYAPNVSKSENRTIIMIQETDATTMAPMNGTINVFERTIIPLPRFTPTTAPPTQAPTVTVSTPVPTTIPTTIVPTTEVTTPPPAETPSGSVLQQIKSLPLTTTVGIGIGVLALIGIIIVIVARSTEAADEDEEYEEDEYEE